MAQDFDSDLGAFFDPDVFGVEAVFAGLAAPVTVIFDRPSAEALEVSGYAPEIWAKSSDVSAVAVGAAVTVNGTAYTVATIEPDGTGVTRMELEAV